MTTTLLYDGGSVVDQHIAELRRQADQERLVRSARPRPAARRSARRRLRLPGFAGAR
jgi:hypothetical protein